MCIVKAGIGYYFADVSTLLFDDETASSLGEQVGALFIIQLSV